MKKIFISIFIILLTAGLSGASEPIKIGVSLGLTGKYSQMSNSQMKGYKLWEKEVNLKGGINGRKINLIIKDDTGSTAKAKSIYESFITTDKVDLLFAPYSSEITEAILPVTEEHRYPILLSGASADSLWEKGYRYAFGVYTPASKYTTSFLEMAAHLNLKSVSIFYADDVFSKDAARGAKIWGDRFGFNVLIFEMFKKDSANFDEIALKAKKLDADILLICGHFNESVNVRLSLKKVKWSPKAYYASVGPATQEFYNKLGKDSEYTFTSTQWEANNKLNLPGSKKFYQKYLNTYNETPTYHSATAYAAGEILETVIKKTESLDREKIREMLSVIRTLSIIGRYGVDPNGMQIKHLPLVIQWQNGKKEVIWPKDLRTSKAVIK